MLIARIFTCALLLGSGAMFAQNTVTCSSDDMHRHHCKTDTRDGVRMVRQRSDAACEQGYSWGYDRKGIWVDHGCRADFAIGNGNDNAYRQDRDRDDRDRDRDDRNRGDNGAYNDNGHRGDRGAVVTCSSDNGKRNYCDADTRDGVRMLRQRSGSECREGHSWGYDDRGIWVDHGCRADFQLGRSNRDRDHDRDDDRR